MTRVNAAVVRENRGAFRIELEDRRDNEVLVRIKGVGLCQTDLVVPDQYFPTPLSAVLEHEGARVVEQVGSAVAKMKAGNHVVPSYVAPESLEVLTADLIPGDVEVE
ncbi:alcohol dehydrogenase [Caballeronia fortuita]|uniref:Alcohol dehydrogenase n=1 Tax=Caballeronia fortuita TaxID=1777138 RepID=A0A158A7K6_9BURK|nr:alcohol dehydrogenase catalytic domain-containing protein [Caballeronia fortuita]SAK53616.1 alcohol dehydrogenase [Caballeronia fortuita]